MPSPPVALQLLATSAATAHPHAVDTVLPRGFFLALGLIYLAALALDRLAERLRIPAAAAILLLGLALHDLTAGFQHIRPEQVSTVERISLALLIFYAGLGTDLRRIRGRVGTGLRLAALGVLITLAGMGLLLMAFATPMADGLRFGGQAGLPLAAAWLTASCLTATDSGALEDLLRGLGHSVKAPLCRLLEFEAALSTVAALLCFGFIAGAMQLHPHGDPLSLHTAVVREMPTQLLMVLRHLLAGVLAGLIVGALAPPLINRLVRSESQLLLLSISLAFVAYGLGQAIGGGGLLAVFGAGMMLSNGRFRFTRFDQQALHRAMHPFNTAAEITVLLLLGLSVAPADLIRVLPLGLLLAVALPLVRLAGVWMALPGRCSEGQERQQLAGCGLRGAVPLGLALATAEALPHLQGIEQPGAELLASHLLAVIFLVVLISQLLQSGWMHALMRWPAGPATAGPQPEAP